MTPQRGLWAGCRGGITPRQHAATVSDPTGEGARYATAHLAQPGAEHDKRQHVTQARATAALAWGLSEVIYIIRCRTVERP